MHNIFFKVKSFFLFFSLTFILSACAGEIVEFQAGDIKDDFCGIHLNYQYCKCAFHNEFCEEIAMNKKEAKKYVNQEYDRWVEKEKQNFATKCYSDNGIYDDDKCEYCQEGEKAVDGECVKKRGEDEELSDDNQGAGENGECKYDSDCDAICEGDTKWKMGCNARTNTCEKTFDTDCTANMENFGELSFSMICVNGECARDNESIRAKRDELKKLKENYSNELKDLNARRDDLKNVMLDANKNCLNGIADMTDVAIIEFAARVASITAGGIPDLASASVDYFNDAMNRLYGYTKSTPNGEQKLKPDEYIKLNCDLYNYFKTELSNSDIDVDEIIENAKEVDAELKALPVL